MHPSTEGVKRPGLKAMVLCNYFLHPSSITTNNATKFNSTTTGTKKYGSTSSSIPLVLGNNDRGEH